MKTKKTPLRMCIVCREMKDKRDLFRIVKNKNGEINADTTGKMSGRGAYICKSKECFCKLKKQNALSRAFSANVSEEVYDILERQINSVE